MRILVADDEATTRLVVKAVVQKLGHECLIANDGDRAWTLLESTPIDVLITDWMMPGLDGPELCRRVRDRVEGGYTYIILVTSLGEQGHVVEGMEAGADDYLTKPLDPFAVQTRLIAAARVTSLHHQLREFQTQLEGLNAQLADQARTDPLTSLGNRLRLHEDLDEVQRRARRSDLPYALAICDLDYFKRYNDRYGHLEGDEALRRVAQAIAASCR
ncbi:MAG: response regulator, partial [Actinobacteria bacterium]|nr:response regulator [Actinomycetota bacterium]